jgi:hypothetical protein
VDRQPAISSENNHRGIGTVDLAMNLETEFRLCLHQQILEWKLRELLAQSKPELTPSTWVKLIHPPTALCSTEALLLCPYSDHAWVAWIPDYGEAIVAVDEMDRLED